MNMTDQQPPHADAQPTIVLVHAAFADASSWSGVIERLHQQGYTVIAPANPLRGVTADSAYTASLLNQIDGPVLLAGHSYGGAVITNAAARAPNVVGLIFVAAFAPDEGERLGETSSESKERPGRCTRAPSRAVPSLIYARVRGWRCPTSRVRWRLRLRSPHRSTCQPTTQSFSTTRTGWRCG
jgi:pimeloyl-ACP methyl ester carboxylesterase